VGEADPVTVVIARQVAPGREREFEDWAGELTALAAPFPGFLGAGLLRPARAGDPWHVVYRFDTPQHLAAWEGSPVRESQLAQGDRLMVTLGTHRVSGLETWFSLPGRTAPAPARWKMFLTSAACIYVLQLAAYTLLGGPLRHLRLDLRLALVVPCVTAMMTWVVMPRVTQWLVRWLYPSPHPRARMAGAQGDSE
jgi:antibiotic biosynthesis monooxygenase (ABM) superfamily enzyme